MLEPEREREPEREPERELEPELELELEPEPEPEREPEREPEPINTTRAGSCKRLRFCHYGDAVIRMEATQWDGLSGRTQRSKRLLTTY